MDLEQKLFKLTQIGIALSSERNRQTLLNKILNEARAFTNAEGGSLYIREGNQLRFTVSQNELLGRDRTYRRITFAQSTMPLTEHSIAGYVTLTGKLLNIPDVYQIPPDAPYSQNREFDRQNQYQTRSMLCVPVPDSSGEIIGVLALLNARDEHENIIPFTSQYESLILCLASQAGVAIKNITLTQKLKEAYLDTVIRLSMAAECREHDIAGHLQRMSMYSAILAEELGFSLEDVDDIRYASPMHDVGKIGIPDAILLKPGKLDEQEYEIMKQHPLFGKKILSNGTSRIIQLSEEIAYSHHEKYDGTGYPQGLKGEAIPLSGRIVALADVFDALASKRAYKDAWKLGAVIDYIREYSGTHFDPQVVAAFERRIADFLQVRERVLRNLKEEEEE
jgi:HD-GYP domain-containing protein (c-di-GMP phosphodiesterase class II)